MYAEFIVCKSISLDDQFALNY